MAAIGYSCSRSFYSFTKLKNPIDIRCISSYISESYHTRRFGYTKNYDSNDVGLGGHDSVADNRFVRRNCVGAFGYGLLHSATRIPYGGIGFVTNYRSYSSATSSQSGNPHGEVPVVPSDGGFGGNNWTDKIKELWKSTVDAVTYAGEKGKELSGEVTPYVQQLLDTHPYLRDVVVPVGSTLMGTLLAWIVLPKILRRFHKYSMQGPATLLSGSSLWGPVPYEKSFWGALEDPIRYLVTFMAFSQM
jgi:mechanosensitive ion channel protein 1/2/3